MNLELAEIIYTFAGNAREAIRREIPAFLAWRGITKLYHFTSIKNLPSIAEHGFLGRETLASRSLEFTASDFVRNEPVLNAICFSFSKPNNLMAARKIASGHQLVLLEINCVAELLSDLTFIATPGNFGSDALKNRLQQWPEEFIGGIGLLNLFLNDELRNKYQIPMSEPTDPQAEILILEPVPWKYVSKLVSPGLKGYATQDEVREVVKVLPKGTVFQSQNTEIFPEINWKDSSVTTEFNERRWSSNWT